MMEKLPYPSAKDAFNLFIEDALNLNLHVAPLDDKYYEEIDHVFKEHADKHINYMSDLWLDSYLRIKDLRRESNYALRLKKLPLATFIIKLVERYLHPYNQKYYRLARSDRDASNLEKIFASRRISGGEKDDFILFKDSRHICLQLGGKIYKVPIKINMQINELYAYISGAIQNKIYANDLDINSSIFILNICPKFSLEAFIFPDVDPLKTLNIIYYLDTKDISLYMEHSNLDGLDVSFIFNSLYEEINKSLTQQEEQNEEQQEEQIRKYFKEAIKTIDEENEEINKLRQAIEVKEFNKRINVIIGVSVDALVQISLLYALMKMEGRAKSIYESCAMNFYLKGRTEAIRIVNKDSIHFCNEAINNNNFSMELLLKANATHKGRVKLIKEGRSYARFIYTLRQLNLSEGLKLELNKYNEAWGQINENFISSSNLGDSLGIFSAFGFPPPSPSTIGFGYLLDAPSQTKAIDGVNQVWLRSLVSAYDSKKLSMFIKYFNECLDGINGMS